MPTSSTLCHVCGSALELARWYEDALIRHGGYGGTLCTEYLVCSSVGCGYVHSWTVTTERPPRAAQDKGATLRADNETTP